MRTHLKTQQLILLFIFWISQLAAQDTNLVNIDTLSIEQMDAMGYRNYPMPSELYFSSYGGNIPRTNDKQVERDRFFPIGWSEDGKFAYAIEPEAENCNCYFVEFYIQDLQTNEILFFKTYNNEDFRLAWDNAKNSEKDSLRDTYKCFYMKCIWYHLYDTLSNELFKHGIIPSSLNYRYRERLVKDEKFSHTFIDSLNERQRLNVEMYFLHDKDTIRHSYFNHANIVGLNYHGYINNPKITDWSAMVLSERHYGIDTAKSENWHYKIVGFNRNIEINYPKTPLILQAAHASQEYNSTAYRKFNLIEQMHDRVNLLTHEQWMRTYGNAIHAKYYDTEFGKYEKGYSSNYGRSKSYGSSIYKDRFEFEDKLYELDRTFYGDHTSYLVYGSTTEKGTIKQLDQLIAYDLDSGEVSFWYDFSSLVPHQHGGIRWLVEEDSLIYIAIGSDSSHKDIKSYGSLMCIDTKLHKVVWQSEEKMANAESFVIMNDAIVSGYSENDEHSLNLVNKKTGVSFKNITMPSLPIWIVTWNEKIQVKTRFSNHEFNVKSSFFESN